MNFIDNIRRKPQEEKIRIIWITVAIAATIMIMLWFISAKFSKQVGKDTTLFRTIGRGIKDIKDNYGK